jgi:hypothetical protein
MLRHFESSRSGLAKANDSEAQAYSSFPEKQGLFGRSKVRVHPAGWGKPAVGKFAPQCRQDCPSGLLKLLDLVRAREPQKPPNYLINK